MGGMTDSVTPHEVKPGQVWADNDKRSKGRHVLVVAVGKPGPLTALVVPCTQDGRQTGHRRTKIRLDRFKPTSTGYRFVKTVEVQA